LRTFSFLFEAFLARLVTQAFFAAARLPFVLAAFFPAALLFRVAQAFLAELLEPGTREPVQSLRISSRTEAPERLLGATVTGGS